MLTLNSSPVVTFKETIKLEVDGILWFFTVEIFIKSTIGKKLHEISEKNIESFVVTATSTNQK